MRKGNGENKGIRSSCQGLLETIFPSCEKGGGSHQRELWSNRKVQ